MDKEPKTVEKPKRKPPAKGGSRKGIPNKNTAELKNMILEALHESGGVDYLKRQAKAKPVAFMALLGKVLPMTIQGTGDDGQIIVEITRFGGPDSAA